MRIAKIFAVSPEKGAETIIYLTSSPDVASVSSSYFYKCRPTTPSQGKPRTMPLLGGSGWRLRDWRVPRTDPRWASSTGVQRKPGVTVFLPATAVPRVDADGMRRDPVTKAWISLLSLEGAMQSVQDQLTGLLRANRTIRFCDACLALKLGAFPREVREAVLLIGEGFQLSSGKCSECLREETVVRALAA